MELWDTLKDGFSNISLQAKVGFILIVLGVIVFFLIVYNWYQSIPPLVT